MTTPVLTADELAVLAEFERRKLVAQNAAKYKASFYEFFKAAWHVLEPAQEYTDNWHVKVLCDHMQYVLEDWLAYKEGRVKQRTVTNLCINIPPGTAKSRIVSVAAPVWWWLLQPAFRWLLFSGNPRVTVRDSVYRRDLIVATGSSARSRPSGRSRTTPTKSSTLQTLPVAFKAP